MCRTVMLRAGIVFLWSCFAVYSTAAKADSFTSDLHDFEVQTLIDGRDHPWGMAFLPGDSNFLVTEKPGKLRLIQNGRLEPKPIKGLPKIRATGQGGLLDVALHPDYSSNRLVYLSYSAKGSGGVGTEVARGELDGLSLKNVTTIFKALPKKRGGRHFGSRLLFLPDGTLLVTLGDRGDRPSAQDVSQHHGSIVRIHDDGSIPADNPPFASSGAQKSLYTMGNRNVQGITIDPASGRVWAHEHGPQGGDEVNLIRAGTNYGWPVITYGRNYGSGSRIGEGSEKSGMAQPLHYWVPSIAPSGLAFYSGDVFPKWKGSLFAGSLKFGLLVRLSLDSDGNITGEERMLEGVFGRIRDVRQGVDGALYLLTDSGNGKLLKIVPL